MKKIKLTQNQFVLIDDEDYQKLNQWKWCVSKTRNNYIAETRKKGKLIYMHRYIINCPKNMQVDHINHNTLDNRKCNLRICNNMQNNANKYKINKKTYSKYKGVTWDKKNKKWKSSITYYYKRFHLGSFSTEIEAAKIYNKYAKLYHGEYAYINQI